jgi:hypothetical protein
MKLVHCLFLVSVLCGCSSIDLVPPPQMPAPLTATPPITTPTPAKGNDIVYFAFADGEIRAYRIKAADGTLESIASVRAPAQVRQMFLVEQDQFLLFTTFQSSSQTTRLFCLALSPDGSFQSSITEIHSPVSFMVAMSSDRNIFFTTRTDPVEERSDGVLIYDTVFIAHRVLQQDGAIALARTGEWSIRGFTAPRAFLGHRLGDGTSLLNQTVAWVYKHEQSGSIDGYTKAMAFPIDPETGARMSDIPLARFGDPPNFIRIPENGKALINRASSFPDAWMSFHQFTAPAREVWYCYEYRLFFGEGDSPAQVVLPNDGCNAKALTVDYPFYRFYSFARSGHVSSYVFDEHGVDKLSGSVSAIGVVPTRVEFAPNANAIVGYEGAYPAISQRARFFSYRVNRATGTLVAATGFPQESAEDIVAMTLRD